MQVSESKYRIVYVYFCLDSQRKWNFQVNYAIYNNLEMSSLIQCLMWTQPQKIQNKKMRIPCPFSFFSLQGIQAKHN